MRTLLASLVIVSVLSCKKETPDNGLAFSNTNWNLYFKHNSSFTFYAQSRLAFDANKGVTNFRFSDTLTGDWTSMGNAVTINFSNGDTYKGTAITADSLSGTLTASGSEGVWYATKQ